MTFFSKPARSKRTPPRSPWFLFLLVTVAVAGWLVGAARAAENQAPPLEIGEGETIALIGNTFADRMRLFGYFETFLHSKYPNHRLKIRNMGWPADEVALRPRPNGFGPIHRYLGEEKGDLIFACFGMNESFKGEDGLDSFREELEALVNDLKSHRYNGHSAPQVVLISPIAHENLGGHLPRGTEHNKQLALYTEAMAGVAEQHELRFVDLFTPTREWMIDSPERKLTTNGIHLTAYGYWSVSQIMARSLGLVDVIASPSSAGHPAAEKLRRAVYDKNHAFFFEWRGPNMEYLEGGRNTMPGAERMSEELVQLKAVTREFDEKVWGMPKPKPEEVWQLHRPAVPMWITPPDYTNVHLPEITHVKKMEGYVDEEVDEILSPDQALAALQVPEGYTINLFASEVDFPLSNPMSIQFDTEGRLWISNTPTWPQPLPGEPPSDSIVILEDTDRDGVADKHTVFMDQLNMLHGFTFGDGGVYISQTPNIIHASDTDGDDRADRFRVVLQGFGSEDITHSINNYKWGPDGALYFMEGIFFHSQVETPHGPRRVRYSGVFRYKPRTERLDVFVSGAFYNPWGQVFDRWGQHIIHDSSSHDFYNMDVLSANFIYPKQKGNPAGTLSFAPGGLSPGGGLATISSRHFPEETQGRLVSNELSGPFRGTRWFDIAENGTSYDLTQSDSDLIVSTDPYFRPVAMACGPDGAFYMVDFYTPVIENTSRPKRDINRDHSLGRIWRITRDDQPLLELPKIVGEPAPALLDLLKAGI